MALKLCHTSHSRKHIKHNICYTKCTPKKFMKRTYHKRMIRLIKNLIQKAEIKHSRGVLLQTHAKICSWTITTCKRSGIRRFIVRREVLKAWSVVRLRQTGAESWRQRREEESRGQKALAFFRQHLTVQYNTKISKCWYFSSFKLRD